VFKQQSKLSPILFIFSVLEIIVQISEMFTAIKPAKFLKVGIRISINRRTATYYSCQEDVKCSAKNTSCISIHRTQLPVRC
jgi:hypothetical protein